MKRVAFKMKLHAGNAEEYQKRHDEIWPELSRELTSHGISDYSIYLDNETNELFGIYSLSQNHKVDDLANHPIMKKWWNFMSDIMETNPDTSPISKKLKLVFYLP